MSFAIAEYDKNGKDIVLATDKRWVCGTVGNYTIQDDDGLKSIDLNPKTAIAFTGHARLMAHIMAELYSDSSLLSSPQTDCLKRLDGMPHHLKPSSREIVERLNEIIPKQVLVHGHALDLSVILAGKISRVPVMYWWAHESNWRGEPNRFGECARVRTMPKEAQLNGVILKRADAILKGRGTVAGRIQKTIEFFEGHEGVVSVGGGCVLRRFKRKFVRN